MKQFPAGFLFGSATSAHQVEGGLTNDWTVWEQSHAEEWARHASARATYGQRPSPVWPEIKGEAKNPHNYRSGAAVDHYHRFEEDLGLAEQLGLNAYRFSVEWSRVEPRPGEYDETVLAHYQQVARACHVHGQKPVVTLWHFTLPQWAAKLGGWESDAVIERFEAYVRVVAARLGDDVLMWATLNEPEVASIMGYLMGIWPPGVRSFGRFERARRGMVRAHQAAWIVLKDMNPEFQVGFCTNQSVIQPGYRILKPATGWLNRFVNDYFPDRLASSCDWLGVQYYQRRRIGRRSRSLHSDLGWDLYPAGHRIVLQRLARYQRPLYVTESGLADGQDRHRAWYIERSLESIGEALEAGLDVRGYFHWSLLDNFEWHEGFWPKFGLAAVDRASLARRLRPSAQHYARLIRELSHR
jgi:beta-glucosidase